MCTEFEDNIFNGLKNIMVYGGIKLTIFTKKARLPYRHTVNDRLLTAPGAYLIFIIYNNNFYNLGWALSRTGQLF